MFYQTYIGEINLLQRTLCNIKIPDDAWLRAFRLERKGFIKNAYVYLADWFVFNREMGRI